LRGAELICNLTNWPVGAESNAIFIGRTRALENKVFLASCKRCCVERGVQFIGQSQAISPDDDIIAIAKYKEEILYSKIYLSLARNKSIWG